MNTTLNNPIAHIKLINERAQRANTRIIQLNTQKEQVARELEAASQESISKFGTNDINELRSIWQANADAQSIEIANFELSLSNAEKVINEIDNALNNLDFYNG